MTKSTRRHDKGILSLLFFQKKKEYICLDTEYSDLVYVRIVDGVILLVWLAVIDGYLNYNRSLAVENKNKLLAFFLC